MDMGAISQDYSSTVQVVGVYCRGWGNSPHCCVDVIDVANTATL